MQHLRSPGCSVLSVAAPAWEHLSWLHLAVLAAHAHASRHALLLRLYIVNCVVYCQRLGYRRAAGPQGWFSEDSYMAERQLAQHLVPLMHMGDVTLARLDHTGA